MAESMQQKDETQGGLLRRIWLAIIKVLTILFGLVLLPVALPILILRRLWRRFRKVPGMPRGQKPTESSEETSAGESGPVPSPRYSSGRILAFAVLALLLSAATMLARLQNLPPDPYLGRKVTSLAWWFHPIERNAYQRLDPDFYDCCELDSGEVWAVGNEGIIVHSNDEGRTWDRLRHEPGEILTSVHFVDKRTGWCAGYVEDKYSVILSTTDGGRTWKRSELRDVRGLFSVFFLDEKRGWCLGWVGSDNAAKDIPSQIPPEFFD